MREDEFTAIAELLTGAEALMARELLAEQGVDAIVQGTAQAELMPLAPGFGARLLVRRRDVPRALELLEATGVLETLRRPRPDERR